MAINNQYSQAPLIYTQEVSHKKEDEEKRKILDPPQEVQIQFDNLNPFWINGFGNKDG